MDTKRKIAIFFIFLILPVIITLRLTTFYWVGDRDTGIYAYIGDMVLEGEIPYRDRCEDKTPLIYYVNALLFRLFGSQFKTISIFEVLWLFVCCMGIYKLSNLIFHKYVSLFVSLIYAIYISSIDIAGGFGMTGTYSILPATIAVFSAIRYRNTSRRAFVFISGLMLSIAFLFRQTAAGVALPIALYLAISAICQKQRFLQLVLEYLIFIAGVLIPLAAISIYFFVNGALDDCISQVFTYNLFYSKGLTIHLFQSVKKLIYATFVTYLGRQPFLICFGIIGILYKLFDFSAEIKNRTLRLNLQQYNLFFMLFFWFLIDLSAIVYSARYFGQYYRHYYIEIVPALALLSGYTIEYLGERLKSPLRLASLIAVFSLFATSLFSHTYSSFSFLKNREVCLNNNNSVEIDGFRYEYPRPELVRWIMANTTRDDFIYFWGAEGGLNFLTKRKCPTKYISLYPLQWPGYAKGSDLKRFIEDLKENRPKFIIDTSSTNKKIPSLNLQILKSEHFYYDWKLLLPAIKFVNENYIYQTTIDGWEIYKQR